MTTMILDYSITMQDTQGRTVDLYINGDSIREAIASGMSEDRAREEIEGNAFGSAIFNGQIGDDAWIACA
jgi:hypothetical protein